MFRGRVDVGRTLRLFIAAVAFFYILTSDARSQSSKWFLCLNSPELVHFYHETNPANCRRVIGVTANAYIVGGVNFALRAKISETGDVVRDGSHSVYVPRGTTVLVLDWALDGKVLVYIWNAHVFVFMNSFIEQPGRKKSFAWHVFDERFDKGQLAITRRKTKFFYPSLVDTETPIGPTQVMPAEVPSGRVVEAHETAQFENIDIDMRKIGYGKFLKFLGYIDDHDVKIISPPKLNTESKYYVGGRFLAYSVKPCWISRSISSLTETSTELGINVGLSNKIAEIKGAYKQDGRSRETLEDKLPTNIEIGIANVVSYDEPTWGLSNLFNKELEAKKTYFTFTSILTCENKKMQIVIKKDNKEVIIDGPMVIRNEDDFQKYADQLVDGHFTPDEALFITAYLAFAKR
jgi:hypothetical protein